MAVAKQLSAILNSTTTGYIKNDSKRKNESEARRATWQQKRPKAWVLQPRKYPNTKRFGRNE